MYGTYVHLLSEITKGFLSNLGDGTHVFKYYGEHSLTLVIYNGMISAKSDLEGFLDIDDIDSIIYWIINAKT